MDPCSKKTPGPQGGRPWCYRCEKAAVVCICDRIRPVPNRTGVVILQHRRERRHPLGTARILRLGLLNCRLVIAGGLRPGDLRAEVDLPPDAALLYPGDGGRDLVETRAGAGPGTLLLLDGTWRQVHALRRSNPWIEDLPRYALRPERRSRYRIRSSPHPHQLATVEAAVLALRHLEPDTPGLDHLLEVFDSMIEDQVRYRRRRGPAPSRYSVARGGRLRGKPNQEHERGE